MIELLGVAIHDPDVVFTDLGLAILGTYLGWGLWKAPGRETLQRAGAVLLGGLASAAFWGALFHAFFPAGTTTRAGFIMWIPVSLSVLAVGTTLLEVGLRVLLPRLALTTRRVIVDTDDRHPRTSIIRVSNNVERSTLPEHPFFILCTSVFI